MTNEVVKELKATVESVRKRSSLASRARELNSLIDRKPLIGAAAAERRSSRRVWRRAASRSLRRWAHRRASGYSRAVQSCPPRLRSDPTPTWPPRRRRPGCPTARAIPAARPRRRRRTARRRRQALASAAKRSRYGTIDELVTLLPDGWWPRRTTFPVLLGLDALFHLLCSHRIQNNACPVCRSPFI